MATKKSLNKHYHLRVFGCQMNKSDAERVETILQKAGYKPIDDEELADVIIAVMCSVRQSPVDRIYGLSGRWQKLKQKTKKLKIILTGCVLDFDKKKLKERFDAIVPITEIEKLPKVMRDESLVIRGKEPGTKNYPLTCSYLNIPPSRQSQSQAYVPIMTGCNNFCAYCVVPFVRSQEVSRPAKEIVDEVKILVKKGYKEITLLGENVNSYESKLKIKNKKLKTTNFPQLLKEIANLPGKFWLRFITSHPKDFSQELIEVVAKEPKVCNHIHLPLQAGSTTILEKMNRKYTKNDYIKLVKKIKREIPGVSLSTDIIVGFPGETKKQFGETARVMQKLKFDMAYIAQYSSRPGTAAAKFEDNVPRKEKKKREKFLTKILRGTALENNQKLVGKTVEVLVERRVGGAVNKVNKIVNRVNKVNTLLIGKTETFKNVRFKGSKNLIGKFIKVKITKANEWGLEGELSHTHLPSS